MKLTSAVVALTAFVTLTGLAVASPMMKKGGHGHGMRLPDDTSFLSAVAKQNHAALQTKQKDLHTALGALCGMDTSGWQTMHEEKDAIRNDTTLSAEQKKEKILAMRDRHKEQKQDHRSQMQSCRSEKAGELEKIHADMKTLMTACFPEKSVMKLGRKQGGHFHGRQAQLTEEQKTALNTTLSSDACSAALK